MSVLERDLRTVAGGAAGPSGAAAAGGPRGLHMDSGAGLQGPGMQAQGQAHARTQFQQEGGGLPGLGQSQGSGSPQNVILLTRRGMASTGGVGAGGLGGEAQALAAAAAAAAATGHGQANQLVHVHTLGAEGISSITINPAEVAAARAAAAGMARAMGQEAPGTMQQVPQGLARAASEEVGAEATQGQGQAKPQPIQQQQPVGIIPHGLPKVKVEVQEENEEEEDEMDERERHRRAKRPQAAAAAAAGAGGHGQAQASARGVPLPLRQSLQSQGAAVSPFLQGLQQQLQAQERQGQGPSTLGQPALLQTRLSAVAVAAAAVSDASPGYLASSSALSTPAPSGTEASGGAALDRTASVLGPAAAGLAGQGLGQGLGSGLGNGMPPGGLSGAAAAAGAGGTGGGSGTAAGLAPAAAAAPARAGSLPLDAPDSFGGDGLEAIRAAKKRRLLSQFEELQQCYLQLRSQGGPVGLPEVTVHGEDGAAAAGAHGITCGSGAHAHGGGEVHPDNCGCQPGQGPGEHDGQAGAGPSGAGAAAATLGASQPQSTGSVLHRFSQLLNTATHLSKLSPLAEVAQAPHGGVAAARASGQGAAGAAGAGGVRSSSMVTSMEFDCAEQLFATCEWKGARTSMLAPVLACIRACGALGGTGRKRGVCQPDLYGRFARGRVLLVGFSWLFRRASFQACLPLVRLSPAGSGHRLFLWDYGSVLLRARDEQAPARHMTSRTKLASLGFSRHKQELLAAW